MNWRGDSFVACSARAAAERSIGTAFPYGMAKRHSMLTDKMLDEIRKEAVSVEATVAFRDRH